MISIKQVLFLALFSIFVLGCGGGSGDGSKSSKAHKSLEGDWTTQCLNVNGTNDYTIFLIGFDTVDGKYIYGEKLSLFETSDCSGNPSLTLSVSGEVDYDGTHSTSICEAEKFDVDYSLLTVNGEVFSGADFDQKMEELNLDKSNFSIACVHRENLYIGLTTSSKDSTRPGRRPVDLNQNAVFFPAN